jgi:hypothetical protein
MVLALQGVRNLISLSMLAEWRSKALQRLYIKVH